MNRRRRARTTILGVAFALATIVGGASPTRAEPDPEPDADLAKTMAADAQLALEVHEEARAGERFDRAHALDGHPIWCFAAAEAWLAAIEPERALERIRQIEGDARLTAIVSAERLRAVAERAERLAPIVQKAKRATLAESHAAAAQAWAEAFAAMPSGHLLLEQARSTLRARQVTEAEAMLVELERRVDLSRAERLEVDEHLARIRAPFSAMPAPARERDSAAPMWLVVGGGALVVGGVVALVVASAQRDDVRAAMAQDAPVRSMTRAEALALEDEARALDVAGYLGGGLGLALAGTGALLGTAGGLGFQF